MKQYLYCNQFKVTYHLKSEIALSKLVVITLYFYLNKKVSIVHRCPTCIIIFHVQWTVKLGSKLQFGIKIRDIMGNNCTKFKVDWTSTSSKTTLTKIFNLKRDERTHRRTNRWMNRCKDQKT